MMYFLFERNRQNARAVQMIYGSNKREVVVAKLDRLRVLHPERDYSIRSSDMDESERFDRMREEES